MVLTRASGPDLVNPVLKGGCLSLCTYLSKFFNHLLLEGKFPQLWKEANLIPIFLKKGDRHLLNNFHPLL